MVKIREEAEDEGRQTINFNNLMNLKNQIKGIKEMEVKNKKINTMIKIYFQLCKC